LRRSSLALAGILALAAVLRLCGLARGIPRYTTELAEHTTLRTSFHPDEDKILWQLERMRPAAGDLDPTDFGWGTLHTYVVGAALEVAGVSGLFGTGGWRAAFHDAREPFFSRVFAVGRVLSALFGIATVFVTFRLGRTLGGTGAGLAAAALLAVSPLHVLHSHYLTADVALAFWLGVALWAALAGRPRLAGFLGGLAVATKPSALVAVPVWLAGGRPPRRVLGVLAAVAVGFLMGEPYAVLAVREWWARTAGIAWTIGAGTPEAFPVVALALSHTWQLAIYGLGPVGMGAALLGLRRTPRPMQWMALALGAALLVSRFPMSRYVLPLLPVLATAAGMTLARLEGPRRALTCALVLGPLATISIGLVPVLRDEHTAARAGDWIAATAVPGSRVAKLWDEMPLLDPARYRLEPLADPFGLEHRAFTLTADYVVLDDLPLHPWRGELLARLETDYEVAARFADPPRLFGFELPEPLAAHDWKYTHPAIRVYARRTTSARQ
jgi:hypothetical protein